MKNLLILFTICLSSFASGQDINRIYAALASGNVEILSSYLDQNVEVHLLDKVSVYDKNLGKKALTKFFVEVAPSECTPIHKGASKAQGSLYSIARLKTNKGNMRVYIFVKRRNGNVKIQELRIDRALNALKQE